MENTISEMFEKQVLQTPNNIAIIDGDRQISYKELNEKVNQFAHYLREKGINKEEKICVVMNHSIEMLVTILAVIKSGAVYIPMEPTFPIKRINFIVNETDAKIVITEQQYENVFERKENLIFYNESIYLKHSKNNPIIVNDEKSLMYVLYTSGTTGTPKGVMVEHGNTCNYVNAFKEYFKITEEDRMLQSSVCTFDIFVEEVFPILLTGGALVIAHSTNYLELLQLIREKEVTITSTFPYFLNDVDKYITEVSEIPDSWKIAISGGDTLRKEYIKKISEKVRVFNTYGPSETTVCASYYEFDKNYSLSESIPIGKSIKNVNIIILDDNLDPVKNGTVGEICISGKGVSRGYLNQPEKTSESFIENPLNTKEILYKTGDLGRVLPDGNLEFIKRKDKQVMILGKRVEPLEVENVMLKNDIIKSAVVKANEDTNGYSYLTAYYTIDKCVENNIKRIKSMMEQYLPDFMIPEFFVKMDEFPITANGKIDLKSLPQIMK